MRWRHRPDEEVANGAIGRPERGSFPLDHDGPYPISHAPASDAPSALSASHRTARRGAPWLLTEHSRRVQAHHLALSELHPVPPWDQRSGVSRTVETIPDLPHGPVRTEDPFLSKRPNSPATHAAPHLSLSQAASHGPSEREARETVDLVIPICQSDLTGLLGLVEYTTQMGPSFAARERHRVPIPVRSQERTRPDQLQLSEPSDGQVHCLIRCDSGPISFTGPLFSTLCSAPPSPLPSVTLPRQHPNGLPLPKIAFSGLC